MVIEGDKSLLTEIMRILYDSKPEWRQSGGVIYDGGAALYSTKPLHLREEERITEVVELPNFRRVSVGLKLASVITRPTDDNNWHPVQHQTYLQAMDTALLSFARWEAGFFNPVWLLNREKVFR